MASTSVVVSGSCSVSVSITGSVCDKHTKYQNIQDMITYMTGID